MSGAARRLRLDGAPPVRGELRPRAGLAATSWFRAGGAAEMLFRPADEEDLAGFLAGCPAEVPVLAIGVASNLLIRDGGVPGVVVKLGRAFTGIAAEGTTLRVGAGALDLNVARFAAAEGLAGLEFLAGIPGTIGGALRMNAGAYGAETRDRLVAAHVVDRQGRRHRMSAAEMGLSYRHCSLPEDWVFTGAEFACEPGEPAAINARIAEIQAARAATQPVKSRTGGSTFANPEGEKAWQLIDRAGCRGLALDGAQVSELHCNFLLNTGTATGAALEALGEEVARRVKAHSGHELRWEIRRIGVPAGHPQAIIVSEDTP